MPRKPTFLTTTLYMPEERAAGLRAPNSRTVYYFKEFSTGTITIGRGAHCDIRLTNDRISQLHAVIALKQDEPAILRDNGSSNGTYIDGCRLYGGLGLVVGMQIQLGSPGLDALLIATNARGAFRIDALDIPEYCYLARELYGNETIAEDFVRKSRKFIKSHAEEWERNHA